MTSNTPETQAEEPVQKLHELPNIPPTPDRIGKDAVREALPQRCDGIEQPAFEEWAKAQGFDMTEHPLHYLFLDARTDAARQAWCAGIKHASDRIAALSATPAQEGEREPVSDPYKFAAAIASEVVPDDADGYAIEGEWKAAWFLARDAALTAYEALAGGCHLRKYVQHLPACRLNVRMGKPCECGLSEALTADPDHPAENKAGGLWYQRWRKAQEEIRELRTAGKPDAEEDDRSWLGESIDRIDAMFEEAEASPAQPVDETERLREALEDTMSTLSAVKAEAIVDGGGTCLWIAEKLNQQMIDNRAALQHKGEVNRG